MEAHLFAGIDPQSDTIEPVIIADGETRALTVSLSSERKGLSQLALSPEPLSSSDEPWRVLKILRDFDVPMGELNMDRSQPGRSQPFYLPQGQYRAIRKIRSDREMGIEEVMFSMQTAMPIINASIQRHPIVPTSGKVAGEISEASFRSVVFTEEHQRTSGRFVASVSKEGSFSVPLAAGRYAITLFTPEESMPKSVTYSGKINTGGWIDLQDDQHQGILVEPFRGSCHIEGSLEGDFRAEKASSGATLQLVVTSSVLIARADEKGHFVAHGLPCAIFRVIGWSDIESVPYALPEVMLRYEDRSIQITSSVLPQQRLDGLEQHKFYF